MLLTPRGGGGFTQRSSGSSTPTTTGAAARVGGQWPLLTPLQLPCSGMRGAVRSRLQAAAPPPLQAAACTRRLQHQAAAAVGAAAAAAAARLQPCRQPGVAVRPQLLDMQLQQQQQLQQRCRQRGRCHRHSRGSQRVAAAAGDAASASFPSDGGGSSSGGVGGRGRGGEAAAAAAAVAAAAARLRSLLAGLVPEPLVRYWPITQRLLVTAGMLAVIRCGYFIPLPGLDLASLPAAAGGMEGERMLRALYGQAQALPASLFDLGISPHINASIIVAMLLLLPKDLLPFPWAERLREARKEGKGGEALINDKINWLALAFAVYTAVTRALELAPYAVAGQGFVLQTALALIAGSFMIHHCANTITAAGVGNGSTLVICMGIITEYAATLHNVLVGLEASSLPLWQLAGLTGGYLGLLLFTVYLASSEVRLPIVQYAKGAPPDPPAPGTPPAGGRSELLSAARSMLDRKAAASGKRGAHFPLLLNASGVMPMIIASATFYGILPKAAELVGLVGVANFIYGLQATGWGLLIYGCLVFCMEFLPFGAVNPPEVAEYFTMIDVGIKGVAPGYATQTFLKQKLRQCKFWGGLALAGLAVTAHLFDQLCLAVVGATLATTSLVIIVGAVLQTARQVASLMEGPRLQAKLDNERAVISSLSLTLG